MRQLIVCLWFGLFVPTVMANAINLPPALAERVQSLQEEAKGQPTDQTNQRQRATLLWEWLNALSREGVSLPVNLTQAMTAIMSAEKPLPAFNTTVDTYLDELSLLTYQPQVLGELTASTGPFRARSFVTIEQTYTVGTAPVEVGGGFLLGRHFMANFGAWQAADPTADNYVSIASSNGGVRFTAASHNLRGMHGGFRSAAPRLVFRVTEGTLQPGDTVTITYGDRTQGSRGQLTPSFESDAMPLPLYLALNAQTPFYTLPIQPIQIVGGPVENVSAFSPSIVGAGESFTVAVRAEDGYVNRATGPLPDWDVYANGQHIASIQSDDRALASSAPLTLPPGDYQIEVASADGRIRGNGNPVKVIANPTKRIYWGDTHGHSGFAEGIGTPERFMTWARDDARLDYVTHSEHDIWMDDHEWQVLKDNVRAFSRDHEFVAFLGYEWTAPATRGGHHNVLFRTPDDRIRIGNQHFSTLSRLYAGLRNSAPIEDVLIIPHAHQAGDYRLSDPQLEPLIEIMSMHGNFEWFGRMYLRHGHQVGFVAASDNHLSQPGHSMPLGGSLSQRGGLGAVMAQEKTADGLFDAMKQLATYATTGDRMIVSFSVNDAPMGRRAPMAKARTISGEVLGTAPLTALAVMKNDQLLWQQDFNHGTSEDDLYLLSFDSDATPKQRGDNPRGWRPWQGTISITGAEIAQASAPRTHNADLAELTQLDAHTLRFTTFTRGGPSSFQLRLAKVSDDAAIKVSWKAGREFGGAPPIYRPHQVTPEGEVTFAIADLEKALSQPAPAVGYVDDVRLRRIATNGKRSADFTITDEDTAIGDYYYLRVTQANDAMAWTSPVWVGGHPSQ